MHEIHLLRDLLNDLLKKGEEEKTTKIQKVYLRMGEFTEINPEILKHFFAQESVGTIAEGAQIEIEPSPTRELRLVSFDCE